MNVSFGPPKKMYNSLRGTEGGPVPKSVPFGARLRTERVAYEHDTRVVATHSTVTRASSYRAFDRRRSSPRRESTFRRRIRTVIFSRSRRAKNKISMMVIIITKRNYCVRTFPTVERNRIFFFRFRFDPSKQTRNVCRRRRRRGPRILFFRLVPIERRAFRRVSRPLGKPWE